MDFRIGLNKEVLGSKNIYDYCYIENKRLKQFELVKLNKNKFLKYVNGETGSPSTQAQHILINNFSKENGITLIGQEAEIEKMNYPMLNYYLLEKAFKIISRWYYCII